MASMDSYKKHGISCKCITKKICEYKKLQLLKKMARVNEKNGGVGSDGAEAQKNEGGEVDPNIKKDSVLEASGLKSEPIKKSKEIVLNFALSAKQQEALNHEAKFLLYGGAKGGGKSWFLCIWVFLMAIKNRGNKLFFCRRRSVDFTNTTLETWKKSIPANLYRINEQKKKIYIDCANSVIDYGGLDDPLLIQGLNSAEYAHIGVDQAEEIEQDSFSMLRGTLRHRLADGSCPKYQIRLTANPAQCWLKPYFILQPEEGTAYIPALPTDNPSLPPDYVENLRQAFKHRPQLLAAYLHGSWDDLSGHDICINGQDIEKARKREAYDKVSKRVVVNDPARFGDDENVTYVMELCGNVARIVETMVLEHKSTMDTAGRLSALRRKHDAQIIAIDSIGVGAGVVDALYELKEPILSINSSSKPTVETEQRKYYNLRSQMWMEAGEKFSRGEVSLPPNDYTLSGQLSSVKFKFTSNGRIQVEAKDEIKKRLGRSPDHGDTLIMGLYALDYVGKLDESQYLDATRDRAGFGIPITMNPEEDYVGYAEDYSGYNL